MSSKGLKYIQFTTFFSQGIQCHLPERRSRQCFKNRNWNSGFRPKTLFPIKRNAFVSFLIFLPPHPHQKMWLWLWKVDKIDNLTLFKNSFLVISLEEIAVNVLFFVMIYNPRILCTMYFFQLPTDQDSRNHEDVIRNCEIL